MAALCVLVNGVPHMGLAQTTTVINSAVIGRQWVNGGDTLIITRTGSVSSTTADNILLLGDATVNNYGSLNTVGDDVYSIHSYRGYRNLILNEGSISTIGRQAFGILDRLGRSGEISNSGSIRTSGIDAHGIFLWPSTQYALVNMGYIETFGEGAAGIKLVGLDEDNRGDYNEIVNSGTLSTSGTMAYGIWVRDFVSSNVILNSGLIRTFGSGSSGIRMEGDSNTLTNSGLISTARQYSHGIYVEAGSSTIMNSGLISTAGQDSHGIHVVAGSNSVTNSGLISTAEESGHGIYSYGDSNAITNSGSISTAGDSGTGIVAYGRSNTIANSGLISTTGSDSFGAAIYGDANSLSNTGSISVSESIAISVEGNNNIVSNSGSISNSNTGAYTYGVYVLGNSNTIANSGSIVSKNSYAIYFNGSMNTFNSLDNFVGGMIFMGDRGTVNFTTGANYSKLYTFGGTSLSINGSGPVPLFINRSTQQAGTYDPTIFASSSDALADMTSTISSLTPGRFSGSDKDHPLWVRGFGMVSSYEGTDATLDRSYNYSGVAIGYDFKRSKDFSLGVLGGYGRTSLWANAKSIQSFNTTSNDGFLGFYGQKRWKKLAVDFALYGGLQSFQQQRYVNDNLAYVGNSSANASYQGWWIAPEAGITYKAGEVNGWSLLPMARLRYAQQWMGMYTETDGGSANATVNGRNVAIGQSFIGIGTRKTMKTRMGKDTKMVIDGQVGYVYRGVVGDDTVGVTMIGHSQSLPTESSSRNAVAVSAGVTLDLSSAVALKIRGDFAAGGGMQYGSGGWAGLSVKF